MEQKFVSSNSTVPMPAHQDLNLPYPFTKLEYTSPMKTNKAFQACPSPHMKAQKQQHKENRKYKFVSIESDDFRRCFIYFHICIAAVLC